MAVSPLLSHQSVLVTLKYQMRGGTPYFFRQTSYLYVKDQNNELNWTLWGNEDLFLGLIEP